MVQEPEPAPLQGRLLAADADHVAHAVPQRSGLGHLGGDVHRAVAIDRVVDDRAVELRRLGRGKSGVGRGRPLHRRAHAVPVVQPDIVAHADLVAVIHHR